MLLLLMLIALTLPTMSTAQAYRFDDILTILGIALPDTVLRNEAVQRPLDELDRERCD
jgi:hypothetical protein